MIHLRRSTVVRVSIAAAVLAALGIGFAIGYAVHSPTTLPSDTTVSGPSLATCTHAVTGHYFPGQNPAVQPGGLSTVQAVGYGCENQAMLSQAMATAGHGTVYNSDVLNMAQNVCNNYPNSPLCVNG